MDRDRFKQQNQQPVSRQPYMAPVQPLAPVVPVTVIQAPVAAPITSAPVVATPQPAATPKEVTININLPKFHAPKITIPKISTDKVVRLAKRVKVPRRLQRLAVLRAVPLLLKTRRKLSISLGALVIIGGVAFGVHGLLASPTDGRAAIGNGKTGTAGQAAAALEQPTFTPVVPKGKPELATPKEGVSSFDGARDSYSFADSLQATKVMVSEQPVPDSLGDIKNAVTTVAGKIGAKEKLTLSNGTTAYMATDKSGAQTIVLGVKDVLIFVQSGFKHASIDWVMYLNNLQ